MIQESTQENWIRIEETKLSRERIRYGGRDFFGQNFLKLCYLKLLIWSFWGYAVFKCQSVTGQNVLAELKTLSLGEVRSINCMNSKITIYWQDLSQYRPLWNFVCSKCIWRSRRNTGPIDRPAKLVIQQTKEDYTCKCIEKRKNSHPPPFKLKEAQVSDAQWYLPP